MPDSITRLLAAYQNKETSPFMVTQALLRQIEQSTLNSFISVQAAPALEKARILSSTNPSEAQPLFGVVIGIKDLVDVKGVPTTMGAEGFDGNIPKNDAKIVARLRAAGAIIIGKTNTHQFAYGPMGDRSAAGPTRNPHNPERMTGGSSSGSAAAVAAGLVHAAIGTDTAASVRLPAAFCGVVGMKPTLGLVPSEGIFPLSKTLDHPGPITRDCHDNARVLAVIAGKPLERYLKRIDKPVAGIRIGLPQHFFNHPWSAPVEAAMANAVQFLKEQGATVCSASIPNIDRIYEAQQHILRYEALALHRQRLEAGAPYESEVRERLLAGEEITEDMYAAAMADRQMAKESFDETLKDVDIILTPTCGVTAPKLQERQTLVGQDTVPTRWLLTRLTAPTNLSGHPSLSVPFGEDEQGLPIGLQLIGRYHDEATLYQVGNALSQA